MKSFINELYRFVRDENTDLSEIHESLYHHLPSEAKISLDKSCTLFSNANFELSKYRNGIFDLTNHLFEYQKKGWNSQFSVKEKRFFDFYDFIIEKFFSDNQFRFKKLDIRKIHKALKDKFEDELCRFDNVIQNKDEIETNNYFDTPTPTNTVIRYRRKRIILKFESMINKSNNLNKFSNDLYYKLKSKEDISKILSFIQKT